MTGMIKQELFSTKKDLFWQYGSRPTHSFRMPYDDDEDEDEDLENAMDISPVDSHPVDNAYLAWWLPPWVHNVIYKNTIIYESNF